MKLSEKIVELRKSQGMTQEELAEICNVSRQSVSKWEADIALPELEKLLLLGNVFHVSMDVLLKDELSVNGIKEMHNCGNNAVTGKQPALYEGTLIKESVTDDSILDLINVHKIELWKVGGTPKYWTVLSFTSARNDLPEEIAKVIQPQFAETDRDTLVTIITRYYEQDSWKEDLVFSEEAFTLLLDILESAGELEKRPPYEDLVDNTYSEKAAK